MDIWTIGLLVWRLATVVGIKASLSPLSVLKQCAFLDGSTSVADGAREGSGKLQN
jgi:hypothetical protein